MPLLKPTTNVKDKINQSPAELLPRLMVSLLDEPAPQYIYIQSNSALIMSFVLPLHSLIKSKELLVNGTHYLEHTAIRAGPVHSVQAGVRSWLIPL